MAQYEKETAAKQIRNLLLVVSSGVVAAILLTVSMVYYYGPSGLYIARNVLLSPATMERLAYNDSNPDTGGLARFIFNNIEFTIYDVNVRKYQQLNIGIEKYQKFYDAVSSDRSIEDVTGDIISIFSIGYPSKLTLTVRAEQNGKSNAVTKKFQEVQFAQDGDYYRVELLDQNAIGSWAYFYHPKIYQEVQNLFIPKP